MTDQCKWPTCRCHTVNGAPWCKASFVAATVDQITVAMALPAVREIIDWLTRETIDIETGEPLFDDAHIDVTAGEVRRRLAPFGKATE